ncbi:3316_t:CDS:2, partial [Acaulospora colombiana]
MERQERRADFWAVLGLDLTRNYPFRKPSQPPPIYIYHHYFKNMPRHNRETSPLNRTRETIQTSSFTRADSAARSLSTGRSSSHRRTASQSEVAPKLGGRAALLLFIAILVAFVVQSSATQASRSAFLTQKIVTTIILTIAIALPGLLWYIAVSLGPSISDVTAIWNTSALWAYILSVAMLPVDFGTEAPSAWWRRLELRKLVVIAMACAGVAVVVYSGSDASSDKKDTSGEKNKSEISAPLL